MYFLSWIIVGLVAGWSAGKILKGRIWSVDGHRDRHWRSCGGRIPHALRRLFWLSRNDLHNASRNNWSRTSDTARRFRERQTDLRAATLNVTSLWNTQMPDTNRAGTILIREDTPL